MLATLLALAISRPPGLPNYTHPTDPAERVHAAARAWAVYDAIDAATPDPALRLELRRVCRRESACNWLELVTWHAGDAAGGRARWRMAVARGWLQPERCPAHELGTPERWTSYGAFGVASAWTVHELGACVGPEALDDPRVAARAAVAWIGALCRRQRACTCDARVRWWVGPGVWALRSSIEQLRAIDRQCGAQPWWRWVVAFAGDVWQRLARVTPMDALTRGVVGSAVVR
jgi:hypothetical protein